MSLIDEIAIIVENACKSESNIFGYEIWPYHIKSVVKHAKYLGGILGADLEVVEIAALLHDYASVLNKEYYEEHHIYGAIEAEALLKKFGYQEDKIELVKDCIISHRGSIVMEKKSIEAIVVSSADAMAHIDNIPSLFHLAYVKKQKNIDEGAIWVAKKIKRSWKKLCPEAKEIMKNKYNSILCLIDA